MAFDYLAGSFELHRSRVQSRSDTDLGYREPEAHDPSSMAVTLLWPDDDDVLLWLWRVTVTLICLALLGLSGLSVSTSSDQVSTEPVEMVNK